MEITDDDLGRVENQGQELGRDNLLCELRDTLALFGEQATILRIRQLLRDRKSRLENQGSRSES